MQSRLESLHTCTLACAADDVQTEQEGKRVCIDWDTNLRTSQAHVKLHFARAYLIQNDEMSCFIGVQVRIKKHWPWEKLTLRRTVKLKKIYESIIIIIIKHFIMAQNTVPAIGYMENWQKQSQRQRIIRFYKRITKMYRATSCFYKVESFQYLWFLNSNEVLNGRSLNFSSFEKSFTQVVTGFSEFHKVITRLVESFKMILRSIVRRGF